MKIAQVAPLYERVPPQMYGGTERVVSYLTEELVSQGHEVTLFASGDSVTSAKLISPCVEALRLSSTCIDQYVHHVLMMEMVQKMKNDFDIIHYHIDYMHFPLSRYSDIPHVTTLHGRLDIPDLVPLYKEFNDIPVISISYNQRKPIANANWTTNVYHGLPYDLLGFNPVGGEYLAWVGRISPEKRVDRAIEISIKCNMPLKIAAKVDKVDYQYYINEIKPKLNHPLIEFIGEIGDDKKSDFIGNAKALLFPIDWPEPFGLVMIEAMACGTPVIAFNNGSVPEIIDEGVTGFIVNSVEEAVEVVNNKIQHMSREVCRLVFEDRFSAERMANDYIESYKSLIRLKNKDSLPELNIM